MLVNNLNNIQLNTTFETKNTNFSSEKQSSEGICQQLTDNNTTQNIFNYPTNKDDDKNQNDTTLFTGYYNMFIASQKLQKSEVLNEYNHQMYMKKYA